jgi:hypothetical protein
MSEFPMHSRYYITDTLKELLHRVEYLTQENQTLVTEHQRNKEFVESWQQERLQYIKHVDNIARGLVSIPPALSYYGIANRTRLTILL